MHRPLSRAFLLAALTLNIATFAAEPSAGSSRPTGSAGAPFHSRRIHALPEPVITAP